MNTQHSQIDLEKLSIVELQALAYRVSKQMAEANNALRSIETMLARKSEGPQFAPDIPSSPAEEGPNETNENG